MFHLNKVLYERFINTTKKHRGSGSSAHTSNQPMTNEKPFDEDSILVEPKEESIKSNSMTGFKKPRLGLEAKLAPRDESPDQKLHDYGIETQMSACESLQSKVEPASILRKDSRLASASKRVSFTDYSEVSVFIEEGPSSAHRKWYSLKDQFRFYKQASLEASRIRDTISKYSLETASIAHLIEFRILSSEDILGIEHKVTGVKRCYERRRHSDYLLDHQDELKNTDISIDQMLASVAIESSSSSAELARLRAALAA